MIYIAQSIIKLMPISIKPIIFFLLIATAFQQFTSTPQPTYTTFNYIPDVSTSSAPSAQFSPANAATSAPSAYAAPARLASPASATPATLPPSSAGPSSTAPITRAQSSLSTSSQSDIVTPNPGTLSSSLKYDTSTTNPTANPSVNTGYYNYLTATTTFTSAAQLNGGCNGQGKISFVAFRQHATQFYLTPNLYFLALMQNSSPNQQQLFTAIQNIDCTWSFKTSDGLYVSLNTAYSYLTLASSLSVGERFYMERKQDWIYVESASSYRYFWTANSGIVLINMNSASRFVMEIWPNLDAGWN